MKFVIFQTSWGFFGLAGTGTDLRRTFLPVSKPDTIEACFLKEFPDAEFDKNFYKSLQKQIIGYFDGKIVDFNCEIHVFLEDLGKYSQNILKACQKIKYGQKATYKELAQKAGYPNSSRAVGNILAKNPVPLIIPCHRIIRTDGKLGGFTAPGGTNLKRSLLLHENHVIKQ